VLQAVWLPQQRQQHRQLQLHDAPPPHCLLLLAPAAAVPVHQHQLSKQGLLQLSDQAPLDQALSQSPPGAVAAAEKPERLCLQQQCPGPHVCGLDWSPHHQTRLLQA